MCRGFRDIPFVLSVKDGEVWVSWPDGRVPVTLGKYHGARAVMDDFIRQSDLGDRLVRNAWKQKALTTECPQSVENWR